MAPTGLAAAGVGIDMTGRSALVTGGAGGLGRACADILARCGGTVVLADRPGDRLDEAVAALSGTGRVVGIGVDLAEVDECAQLPSRAAVAAGNRLDVLVNAVGIMQTRPFDEVTPGQWQRTVDINLTGVFHTVQAAARLMRTVGGGSIVTLASVAGRSGRPNAPDYAATKAALISLTKSAAMAFAPHVRVNAVCPGVFLTPMWDAIVADRDREFGPGAGQAYLDEVAARTPLRRVGDPEDVARAVAFLASDLAGFITGQALNVCGGLEMD